MWPLIIWREVDGLSVVPRPAEQLASSAVSCDEHVATLVTSPEVEGL